MILLDLGAVVLHPFSYTSTDALLAGKWMVAERSLNGRGGDAVGLCDLAQAVAAIAVAADARPGRLALVPEIRSVNSTAI